MGEMTEIRILRPDDAEDMFALRRQSLDDTPLAFAASPEDDLSGTLDAVRAMLGRGDDSVVFGAIDGHLVGMLGLHRLQKIKLAHKVVLWGTYVRPEARGRGIAGRLLRAALDHSRTLDGVTQVLISASDDAPGAKALYEGMGFQVWGTEPNALRHGGRGVDETHMVLLLNQPDR